jgi:acetylornithine deacetylase
VSDVAELAAQLVAIESINPDVVAGGSGELEIARFVAEWCDRAGLETTLSEPAPGRPNVVAVARGSGDGRSLVLNAHMDTVGVAGMTDPFTTRLEGGRLYGRGSYDMKGSLAACMLAAAEARSKGLGLHAMSSSLPSPTRSSRASGRRRSRNRCVRTPRS